MNRYALRLSKTGYMKYISHLDLTRLFKNAFKRAGIRLVYSKGYNPHPKMSFASPLSLGYSSVCELLEFECQEALSPKEILDRMKVLLPKGIDLLSCETLGPGGKTLASRVTGARYKITIPIRTEPAALRPGNERPSAASDLRELCAAFFCQTEIIARKKSKKMKEARDIDIKPMTRDNTWDIVDDNFILYTTLDAGSNRTLSPELLIGPLTAFAGLSADRADVEVERTALYF